MVVLVRTARRGGSNEYPQSMFRARIWKISEFLSENFPFLVVKYSIYLNMRVFVMKFKIAFIRRLMRLAGILEPFCFCVDCNNKMFNISFQLKHDRVGIMKFEPAHDKTYKVACAPSEDSDQPGHPPRLIGVFAVRMKKSWVLCYPLSAQRRLIRLSGCPGWSEFSLGAYAIL